MSDAQKQQSEIDLIELVKILWKKKVYILCTAFVTTVLAGIYAFTATEKWTAKAEVIAPHVVDLGDYFHVRQEYNRILGLEFKVSDITNDLYAHFSRFIVSNDEKRQFFLQSALYQHLAEGKDERGQRAVLAELVDENIKITKPDAKKEPDLIGQRVMLSAETAADAKEMLEQFLSNAGRSAFELNKTEFLTYFQERLRSLRFEAEQIDENLKIQKTVQLENLQNALTIARNADIKEFSSSINNGATINNLALADAKVTISDSKLNDGTYLFMLGEKFLQAQYDAISSKEVIYPPKYFQIQEQLKKLEPLFEQAQKAEAKAFSYQATPDYPAKRDWPKRAIILLIGAVFGSILGSLIVLVKPLFGK